MSKVIARHFQQEGFTPSVMQDRIGLLYETLRESGSDATKKEDAYICEHLLGLVNCAALAAGPEIDEQPESEKLLEKIAPVISKYLELGMSWSKIGEILQQEFPQNAR